MAEGKFNVKAVFTELNNATHVNTLLEVNAFPVRTYVMNVRKHTKVELQKKSDMKTDLPLDSILIQDISVL